MFGLWPTATPFGNSWYGSVLLAVMSLVKSAYWKMNSFSLLPPSTELWLTLIELNLFLLSPQALGARLLAAP